MVAWVVGFSQANGRAGGWVDGLVDERMDGRTRGLSGGWPNGRIHRRLDVQSGLCD